jgi:SUMO ligase MMS21 Smc5/6 complex component
MELVIPQLYREKMQVHKNMDRCDFTSLKNYIRNHGNSMPSKWLVTKKKPLRWKK